MSEDRPQINLITPPVIDLETFPDRLAAVMDQVEIACLRLSLATKDPDDLGPGAQRGVSHSAHQTDLGPAIDQPQAASGDLAPHGFGGGAIDRVAARARPAEHADGGDGAHQSLSRRAASEASTAMRAATPIST